LSPERSTSLRESPPTASASSPLRRRSALAAGGPAAEARHAVLHEGALTLEDVWVRRTARAWFSPDPLESLQPLADAMVPLLGWSPTDTAAQIAACRAIHEGSLAAIREPVPA
jgi:glycerol-3-phosphate dehydrogenase